MFNMYLQEDLGCDVCKFVIQYIERELNSSKSIAAINATLEKLCNAIPDAKAKDTVSHLPNNAYAI